MGKLSPLRNTLSIIFFFPSKSKYVLSSFKILHDKIIQRKKYHSTKLSNQVKKMCILYSPKDDFLLLHCYNVI